MTTAARPTFDHAKGKANNIKSTIQHKRAVTQNSQLKTRKRVKLTNDDFDSTDDEDDNNGEFQGTKYNISKRSVIEFKRQLLQDEQTNNVSESSLSAYVKQQDNDDSADTDEEVELRRQQLLIESRNEDLPSSSSSDENSDNDNENDSSESGDDEDDEDEELLLLKELEKIKEERLKKKAKEDEEELTRRAMSANPLIRYSDDEEDEEEEGGERSKGTSNTSIKKSWRSQAVFKNQYSGVNKGGDGKDRFVNDMLKSEFHKKFMDKYIK